jgi:DNA-binding NarL/FixJ family response regulator
MDVLLLTGDLMVLSTVTGSARKLGLRMDVAATPDELVEQVRADPTGLVVLDLSFPDICPDELVPLLRSSAEPPRRIVAFGPHVHEKLLEAARAAGCDEVVSRGQFHAGLDEILASATRE